jgi:FtsP/CotA-like multicopper oxidase with cupredoxin domain/plastocyanin
MAVFHERGGTGMADGSDRQEGIAVVGVFLGLLAVLGSVFGVGLGLRAIDRADSIRAGGGSGETVQVSLSEMKVDPAMIHIGAGGTLDVENVGSAVHNLTVKGQDDLTTGDIAAGESASIDISSLAPGDYTVICTIPGHEAAGMTASLMIGAAGSDAASGSTATTMISADAMDEAMAARTAKFPAKTAGVGAQELAPKVLADGTKTYDLTASVFPWEVEPGKVVQAWGYNEQVPGPTIRLREGDRVRITLHNELPESTVIHFHGLLIPNAMDGVPDITQPAVKPGESFTYEFTAKGPAVGMYHSHHNAQKQVANGLLGAIYVDDVALPAGTPPLAYNAPMVLNDNGVIGYSLNGKSFPATAPIVVKQGEWVKLDYLNEGAQVHPMHLHGMPQLVIARDGFNLPQPQYEDTVLVAPGQRVSVLVHATEAGTWAWHCHILSHAESEVGMFGMVTAMVVQ